VSVPDVASWVGAIDHNIGVAFRYVLTIAITCVPIGITPRQISVYFVA